MVIKRVNNRTPKDLLENLRLDHPRTVVATYYDKIAQHTRYYLGTNRMGNIELSNIYFRASQLGLWIRGKIGRPREKRRYRRRSVKPQGILV